MPGSQHMQRRSDPGRRAVVLEAAGWGAVVAMAMSGMRTVTTGLGMVSDTRHAGSCASGVRRPGWVGPGYGLLVWLGFEAVLASALDLSKAKTPRPVKRAAFAADHILYGAVLARGLKERQRGSPCG